MGLPGKRLWTAARATVSIALIAWVVANVGDEAILSSFERAWRRWYVLVPALLVLPAVGLTLSVVRLTTLLRVHEIRVAFGALLRVVLIGAFFNQLLPTSVGGDAYCTWHISKRGARISTVVATLLAGRVLGVAAMCVLVFVGVATNPNWIGQVPGMRIAVVALAVLLAVIVSGGLWLRPPSRRHAHGRWHPRAIWSSLMSAFQTFRSERSAIATASLLSILLQAEIVVQYWLFGASLDINLTIGQCLVAVPLVTLAAMAPISLNGIGVREWVMIWICVPLGIAESDAAVMALLFLCGNLAYAGVGAVLFGISKDGPCRSGSSTGTESCTPSPHPPSDRAAPDSHPQGGGDHESIRSAPRAAQTRYAIPGCRAGESSDQA